MGLPFDTELSALVTEARSLREVIRELLEQRKDGGPVDVGRLNCALACGSYRIELAHEQEGNLLAQRRYTVDTTGQILMPLATAAERIALFRNHAQPRECRGW